MRRHGTCPFCHKPIIADDAAQTILHAEPVCAAFNAKMRAGVKNPADLTVRRIHVNDIETELAKDVASVRRKKAN